MGWFTKKRKASNSAALDSAVEATAPTGKDDQPPHPYADDALKNLAGDELNRRRLAQTMSRVLTNISGQSESAVVALVGQWGSGKSTLLDAIETELRTSASWRIAHYNPWSFSTLDAAVIGFFSELSSALPKDSLQQDRRAVIGEWAAKVAPIGAVGGIVGIDATTGIESIARMISGDQSPEKLRERASQQLSTMDKPILMVLDDLDRLEPKELLLTFKLIRLLGRLPNVFYLLAYDEETLEAVLQRTDLVGSAKGRARDYLEKMVQIRLDIPPLLDHDKGAMVDSGLNTLLSRHGIELSEDATSRLQSGWSECLSRYLSQPRAIKKLLGQVDALWPEVAGEVDFTDFFFATFLRTFERSVFDLMIAQRSELLRHESLSYSSLKETHQQTWDRWTRSIEDAGAKHPQNIAALLAEMFLPLRSAKENMTYGSAWMTDVERRRGIGASDFFDRYTQLGVPVQDISDAQLARAIQQLSSAISGDELKAIERRMDTDAGFVSRRLFQYDEMNTLPERATILFLGRHYEAAITQKSGLFGFSPDFGLLGLSRQLLNRLEEGPALEVLAQLAQSRSGLAMAADLAHRALQRDVGDEIPSWLERGAPLVEKAIEAHIRSAALEPLSGASRTTIRMLWALRQIAGEGAVRRFVWELIDDAGPWNLEDFLAFIIPLGTSSDGRRVWDSLGDLSAGDIDGLLGLDDVLGRDLPSKAEGAVDRDRDEGSTSFAARRRNAIETIGMLKRKRDEGQDSVPMED